MVVQVTNKAVKSSPELLSWLWSMGAALLCVAMWATSAQAQGQRPAVSGVFRVQPAAYLPLPSGWTPPAASNQPHTCAGGHSILPKSFPSAVAHDPDAAVVDLADDAQAYAKTAQFAIGRNFTVNNLTGSSPGDNSMAISNGGFIVSADNGTVDYYFETPDTLLQFQPHTTFFGDTTITHTFDPRVLYDRYTNRFIVVMVENSAFADNFLRVSFSKSEDPRGGWNHYRINSDTLDVGQWLDHPMIAINRDELFISGTMTEDISDFGSSNKIFQVKKQDGYDSLALRCKVWTDILQTDGDTAVFLFPFSDGLMGNGYQRGMYLANTANLDPGQSSDRIFWYHILDSLGGIDSLASYSTSAIVPYEDPRDGFQLGSQEEILLNSSRIQSGYHLNDKLFFVYCKNTDGYCTVALNILDLDSNIISRTPWGFSSGFVDDCYPSIAPLSVDSLDDLRLAMTFQRTGISLYPQMRCVYFDNGFQSPSLLVQAGLGPISLPFVSPERWGDYTISQRRYGPSPAVWAVGSYPVGPSGNWFGNPGGLNGYLVELLADTSTPVRPVVSQIDSSITVYPNPASDEVYIQSLQPSKDISEITLIDMLGQQADVTPVQQPGNRFKLDLASVPPGTYVLHITINTRQYVYFKIVHQ